MESTWYRLIAFISILLCSFQLISQESITIKEGNNIFASERISIETGIGLQNGGLGIRGKYFFSDYVGSSIGLGYLGSGLIWNFSIEARYPNIINSRISPFFNIMYGINAGMQLQKPNNETDDSLYKGFSSSLGLKLNLIKKWSSYMSLGINYRFLSSEINSYLNDFNSEFGTMYERNHGSFFPIIGFTFCF